MRHVKPPLLYSHSRSHFNLNKRLNLLDHGIKRFTFLAAAGTYAKIFLKKQNLHSVMFVFDISHEYTCLRQIMAANDDVKTPFVYMLNE